MPTFRLIAKIQRVINGFATETTDVVNFIRFLAINQMSHAGAKLKIGIQSFSRTWIFGYADFEKFICQKVSVWPTQDKDSSIVGCRPACSSETGQILNLDLRPGF